MPVDKAVRIAVWKAPSRASPQLRPTLTMIPAKAMTTDQTKEESPVAFPSPPAGLLFDMPPTSGCSASPEPPQNTTKASETNRAGTSTFIWHVRKSLKLVKLAPKIA
ncbi:hypothetical protein J2T11_000092 [Paenarthrobacter nicotinovorans]|nr:hypothetical protein [Paenarthrobacter nicotinovorans]